MQLLLTANLKLTALILAISRVCLAVEYGATLWSLRRFKKARLPIYAQVGLHVVSSLVYFGLTFCFTERGTNRAYKAWYLSGTEAIGSLVLSNFSTVLSLTETHLMKRITLLTVMIMGDGIIQIAKEVVIIMRNPAVWGNSTKLFPVDERQLTPIRRRFNDNRTRDSRYRNHLLSLPHVL